MKTIKSAHYKNGKDWLRGGNLVTQWKYPDESGI
jgi:hypothetical protein